MTNRSSSRDTRYTKTTHNEALTAQGVANYIRNEVPGTSNNNAILTLITTTMTPTTVGPGVEAEMTPYTPLFC